MAKAAGVSDDRGVGIDERHAGRVDDGALDGAAATQVPRTTRVACIDDDTLIREGITRLLHDVTVVGAFRSVEAFLAECPDADVVLLDLWLSGPHQDRVGDQGLTAVRRVSAAGYRVLIYTNERRRHVLAACLGAGAHGIIHKSESLDALLTAVKRVDSGAVVTTTALAGLAEVLQRKDAMPGLTPRQLEVLRARARGLSYKAIGSAMFLSPKTVEEYMAEVNRKFADYLRDHSPADLERLLGVGQGDLASAD